MASNAQEYADSLAEGISAMTDAGSPFGWFNEEEYEWSGDMPEGWDTDHDYGTPWREADAGEYIDAEALDIEYTVTRDREYRSAHILITFGGPNATINTGTRMLEVSWASATEYRTLPSAFVNGLDEFLSEIWESN